MVSFLMEEQKTSNCRLQLRVSFLMEKQKASNCIYTSSWCLHTSFHLYVLHCLQCGNQERCRVQKWTISMKCQTCKCSILRADLQFANNITMLPCLQMLNTVFRFQHAFQATDSSLQLYLYNIYIQPRFGANYIHAECYVHAMMTCL